MMNLITDLIGLLISVMLLRVASTPFSQHLACLILVLSIVLVGWDVFDLVQQWALPTIHVCLNNDTCLVSQ